MTDPAERVRALTSRKDDIELQLSTHLSILKQNSSTLHSPLVDRDGFPRDDIDVYAVRNARVRIIELRNDLEAVMGEIGKALEGVYDPSRGSAVTDAVVGTSDTATKVPFAKVGSVAPNSPAAEAGLQRDDLIFSFGHLSHASCTPSLQPLTKLVSEYENRSLPIGVLRDSEVVRLSLTPRKGWGGPGMLGCHVVPYTSTST